MKLKKLSLKVIGCLVSVSLFTTLPSVTSQVSADNWGNLGDLDRSILGENDTYPENKIESISANEISEKVEALLLSMTEDEKLSMLGGDRAADSYYGFGTGYQNGVARLGVPVMRMWDGPQGVIPTTGYDTTAPASEPAVGSSFSRDLAYNYGVIHGTDNKANAANVQLGIQLDHIRTPHFKRSRDSLSEDAFLTGSLGTDLAQGIQDQNVMATLKHMAAYSQWYSFTGDNVQVDEQTLHELYLLPYKMITEAGASSAIMSSYNRVNGTQASANSYLLKNVLRDMWNFSGLTMTDWGGNTQLSTHLGTDLETGSKNRQNAANVRAALEEGTLTWADIDNAVRHTLTALGEIGYLGLVEVKQDGTCREYPENDCPAAIEMPILEGEDREKLLAANDALALESAVKGAVLLKNENQALPVNNTESIAVIGLTSQYPMVSSNVETAFGWLKSMTSSYENLIDILGDDAEIQAEIGIDTVGETVPANVLYTDESLDANGVTVEGSDGILPTIELTTGSDSSDISGINRSYINAADGTAAVNGETISLTSYLQAPESGEYTFKLLGVGGTRSYAIFDSEGNELTSASITKTGAPTSGLVRTAEGMDIPSGSQKVTLAAGEVYKITASATGTVDVQDSQMRLVWFRPSYEQENYEKAVQAASENETVIVFAHDLGDGDTGMGMRSSFDLDDDQLELLEGVIKAAKIKGNKVVVVLNIGLPVTMEWLDDVDAVLNMWLPGQAGGKATAQLLTGVENPSGKLAVTFPNSVDETAGGESAKYLTTDGLIMSEGIFSGYRYYDQDGVDYDPLFDFGFGLSYTNFEYSNLQVTPVIENEETAYDITVTVTNKGTVTGSEVIEVYLGAADTPDGVQMAAYQLAQYDRAEDLAPQESKTLTMRISQQSLSYWDATDLDDDTLVDEDNNIEKWVLAEGKRQVYVGGHKPNAANENTLLSATLDVGNDQPPVEATVTLDQSSAKLAEGATIQLKASVLPADADVTLTWTSSDTSIASVSQNGLVTAIKEGSSVITVTLSNGSNASCTITVTAKETDNNGSSEESDSGSESESSSESGSESEPSSESGSESEPNSDSGSESEPSSESDSQSNGDTDNGAAGKTNGSGSKGGKSSPKTGDTIPVSIILLAILSSGAMLITIKRKAVK